MPCVAIGPVGLAWLECRPLGEQAVFLLSIVGSLSAWAVSIWIWLRRRRRRWLGSAHERDAEALLAELEALEGDITRQLDTLQARLDDMAQAAREETGDG